MKRILVCLDLSPITDDVIRWAIRLGKSTNAVMELAYVSAVHAEKVTHVVSSDNQQRISLVMRKENSKMDSYTGKVKREGLKCGMSILHGNVSESLIKKAKEFDASMIVIGSRTTNAATHAIKGSVGADLLKGLKIPVLLVPASE
jgi:nucleotide-binding universal stress UspA family protein